MTPVQALGAARPGRAARELERHSRRSRTLPEGDVALLDAGDPDAPTAEHVRRALHEAVEAGATHYGHPFGDPDLRAALAARASATTGWPVAPGRVLVTHGASGGLGAAILATVDPGDRVLLQDPTYSLYADQVRVAGGLPVSVPTRPDFHLDAERLAAAAPGARMIVLCHPSNPTGVVHSRDELEAVAAIAERHDLLVLADEAYDAIIHPPTRFVSTLEIPALEPRLLYCQTLSKTYAMTGWRVGWVIAPEPLAAAVGRLHVTLHGPMNTAVQRAALAAVTGPDDATGEMLRTYARRRSHVIAALAAMPGVVCPPPEATFYAFLRYPQAVDAVTMQARCLEGGVALRAGSEFGDGGERHLRLSYTAADDDLDRGLERLAAVLARP